MGDAQRLAHYRQLSGIDELHRRRPGEQIDDKIDKQEEGASENRLALKGSQGLSSVSRVLGAPPFKLAGPRRYSSPEPVGPNPKDALNPEPNLS